MRSTKGRGLLDDLLVPALNRAFPFPDGPHRAVRVGHDLHLDVVPGGQVALAEHGRVAERGLRLAAGRLHFAGQGGQFAHHPHPAPAATGGGLDQHGQLRLGDRVGVELVEHRDPGGGHQFLGLDLGAHRAHRVHRRPDPGQARALHGGREIGVLREEPVARVHGVGAGRAGGRDDRLGVEVVVGLGQPHARVGLGHVRRGGVRVGVDGDGSHAQPPAGGEHPAGDLAAVGDQHSSDHGAHIRKTPKFDVPLIGPLAMADRHIPSTVRVSRGSITPSS